jgi:Icc-related predicted phosphoesterase
LLATGFSSKLLSAMTKLLLTTDLHQHIPKWPALVKAASQERPDFVLIAGDLLPKDDGFEGQRNFFTDLRRHFAAIKSDTGARVLTFLGNDDLHVLEPRLDELAAAGLCVNLNGRVHREAGLVFCGMNKVRDYPFGYKHWCVPDDDYVACPVQFCGQGLTVSERGEWLPLADLREHLSAKPGIREQLDALRRQLAARELSRSIWMIHQPPAKVGMDICADGRAVGSDNLHRFIAETQPLLGCSGHIHESPYQPGGQWAARIQNSLWLQPGQMGERLHYVTLLLAEDLRIQDVSHSIFGRWKRMPRSVVK